ncbi:MAG: hypothetical protein K6T86_12110 [Pirellulales bacterium]|nr:hypothetical protein [Pirellulales bacterium]
MAVADLIGRRGAPRSRHALRLRVAGDLRSGTAARLSFLPWRPFKPGSSVWQAVRRLGRKERGHAAAFRRGLLRERPLVWPWPGFVAELSGA